MDTIYFYRVRDEYGCFSNFSKHPVELDGKLWLTSEHYFQAKKFEGTKHETDVRKAKNPKEAAEIGRDRNRPLRKDWEYVKDDIMRKVVEAKFRQHKDIRELLLSTGDAILIEHTQNDNYWGDGGNGYGRNMLGKILMEIRSKLRSEQ